MSVHSLKAWLLKLEQRRRHLQALKIIDAFDLDDDCHYELQLNGEAVFRYPKKIADLDEWTDRFMKTDPEFQR